MYRPNGVSQTDSKWVSFNRLGAKTPNFFEAVSRGEWINPLPYQIVEEKNVIGTLTNSILGSSISYVGVRRFSYTDASLGSSPCALARAEIDSCINKRSTSIDMGNLRKLKGVSIPLVMAFLERKETAGLMVKTLGRFIKAAENIRHPVKFFKALGYKASRRTRLKMKRSLLRNIKRGRFTTVGDAWLEYRYAWLPLMMDIHDLSVAASKVAEKEARRSVSSSGAINAFGSVNGGFPSSPANDAVKMDWAVIGHIKRQIYYRVDSSLLSLTGAMMHPLAIAWDVVPWSFVVDWFANISDYLDLQNATLGLVPMGGYSSTRLSIYINPTSRGKVPWGGWGGWYETKGSCIGPVSRESFSRVLLTNFPSPSIVVSNPIDALTHNRILDSIALLSGVLKSKLN